jgi:hypothetical protein
MTMEKVGSTVIRPILLRLYEAVRFAYAWVQTFAEPGTKWPIPLRAMRSPMRRSRFLGYCLLITPSTTIALG